MKIIKTIELSTFMRIHIVCTIYIIYVVNKIPLHAPTEEVGFPMKISRQIHIIMAAAPAVLVLTKAWQDNGLADNALPALKPIQPNQKMAVPNII